MVSGSCSIMEDSRTLPIIKRPELIEISQENDEQTKSKIEPKIEEDKSHEIVSWEITDIIKGKTFRIEW